MGRCEIVLTLLLFCVWGFIDLAVESSINSSSARSFNGSMARLLDRASSIARLITFLLDRPLDPSDGISPQKCHRRCTRAPSPQHLPQALRKAPPEFARWLECATKCSSAPQCSAFKESATRVSQTLNTWKRLTHGREYKRTRTHKDKEDKHASTRRTNTSSQTQKHRYRRVVQKCKCTTMQKGNNINRHRHANINAVTDACGHIDTNQTKTTKHIDVTQSHIPSARTPEIQGTQVSERERQKGHTHRIAKISRIRYPHIHD